MKKIASWINNRKMGVKLLVSFLLVVVITGALVSGISFYQYAQTSNSLNDIVIHQIPVAKYATNVEQHVMTALENEKSYLLTGDEQYKQATIQSISRVNLALSEITRFAQLYEDRGLSDQGSVIWLAVESYRQSFQKLSQMLETNQALRQVMKDQSDVLLLQINTYLEKKLAEDDFTVKESLLVGFEILKSIQNVQNQEKEYLLSGDASYLENLYAELDAMDLAFSRLNKFAATQDNADLVFASREAAASYREAVESYAANQSELAALRTSMQDSGSKIQENAQLAQINSWNAMGSSQVATSSQLNGARMRMFIVLGISLLLGLFLARVLSLSFTRPIKSMANAAGQIAKGDLMRDTSDEVRSQYIHRQDEIGDMARAFEKMVAYLQNLGAASGVISKGDLTIEVEAASDQDELGESFHLMVDHLRSSIREVAESVGRIRTYSNEMSQIANQSDHAAMQISETMQQVARGTSEQSEGINQAMEAINRSQESIARIVAGIEQQTAAVEQGVNLSETLTEAILHSAQNIQGVVKESDEATKTAQSGAVTISDTLKDMEGIQHQVTDVQTKMQAMQQQTNQIGTIVETIEEIAAQTNLLAINATIEAAHAESDARTLTESMLERFMLGYSVLVARLLEAKNGNVPTNYWMDLGRMSKIDQILITDDDGVIRMGNDASLLNWRFPEDNPQTAEFRELIYQKDGRVCQKAQMRAHDSQVFKYVGVSRRDTPGVVQVGYNMSSLQLFNLQIGGFAIVAGEVYRLAERSREATKEIRTLLDNIKVASNDASQAMQGSVSAVSASLSKATNASESLAEILSAFQRVSQETQLVAEVTAQMQEVSDQFGAAMQAIQEVVDANNEVTRDLSERAGEMSVAVNRIASVSEENSAATEEVSASAVEMRSQVQEVAQTAGQLNEMANNLNEVVTKFKLEKSNGT